MPLQILHSLTWEETRLHILQELERLDSQAHGVALGKDLNQAFARIRTLERQVTNLRIRAAALGGSVAVVIELAKLLVQHFTK
jgi:hypothetical protein